MITLSFICKFPKALPHFVQSGLVTTLVTYASVVEAGRDNWPFYELPIAKFRNFGTVFDVDIQLKKELWLLIQDILKANDPDVVLCVACSPFVSVLFSYLERDSLGAHSEAEFSSDSHLVEAALTHGGSKSLLPHPPLQPDYSGIPEVLTQY